MECLKKAVHTLPSFEVGGGAQHEVGRLQAELRPRLVDGPGRLQQLELNPVVGDPESAWVDPKQPSRTRVACRVFPDSP